MAGIDDSMWRLADVLKRLAGKDGSSGVRARCVRTDPDGTAWLSVPGNPDMVPVSGGAATYSEGDEVEVGMSDGVPSVTANVTQPPVGMREVTRHVNPVRKLAKDAKAVADAIGQHFWHDGNGAHISTEEGNPTGPQNALWNSLGMLFRQGANILLAIVTGDDPGMDIYDGQGNEDGNVIASHRGSGTRIGYADGSHLDLSGEGVSLSTEYGDTVMSIKSTGAQEDTLMRFKLDSSLAKSSVLTATDGSYNIVEWPLNAREVTPEGTSYVVDTLPEDAQLEVVASLESGASSIMRIPRTTQNTQTVYLSGVTVRVSWSPTSRTMTLTATHSPSDELPDITVTMEHYWSSALVRVPTFLMGSGIASGAWSAAIGRDCEAMGAHSQAHGYMTHAGYENQLVAGQYNSNVSSNLVEIGNGTSSDHMNAFVVRRNGTIWAWNFHEFDVYNILGTVEADSHVHAVQVGSMLIFSGVLRGCTVSDTYYWTKMAAIYPVTDHLKITSVTPLGAYVDVSGGGPSYQGSTNAGGNLIFDRSTNLIVARMQTNVAFSDKWVRFIMTAQVEYEYDPDED